LALARRLVSRPIDPDSPPVRKEFVNRARPLTPLVAVETDDRLLFLVSTRDRLGRGVFAQRGRQDMDVLDDALRTLNDHGARSPGQTFVDVGANLGTTTVTALRRHGFKRGVALEPEPGNFRILRLNLVANEVDSLVTAFQAAVSDRMGEAQLRVSSRSSGVHELVDSEEETVGDDVISVPVITLDSLVRDEVVESDDVGVLWVDAAGGEASVLAGAGVLLEQGMPIVFAVRPGRSEWPEVRERMSGLLAGYTHFAGLRPVGTGVSRDLGAILDTFSTPGDVLAFRG
jgi:FkbM family methyltransferase